MARGSLLVTCRCTSLKVILEKRKSHTQGQAVNEQAAEGQVEEDAMDMQVNFV